jgi:hypothetical protein
MVKRYLNVITLVFVFAVLFLAVSAPAYGEASVPVSAEVNSSMPWWAWPLILFVVTFLLGIAAVLVNVVASLILVPVAIFVFKDKLNWVNIVGILVCLVGLVMLNWKR